MKKYLAIGIFLLSGCAGQQICDDRILMNALETGREIGRKEQSILICRTIGDRIPELKKACDKVYPEADR